MTGNNPSTSSVRRILYIEAAHTNPYRNIAIEEYLLHHVEQGECILYLWQNQNTVVIGRNQNCWKECRVTRLEEDGGHLARRLSGGGAVFHDLGNLNFTFLASRDVYDVERQLSVIVEACRRLGIVAEKTGRNDITVKGKKFSGNAFYQTEKSCYHHGTLLLRVDTEKMGRYLSVAKDKLEAKGVASVQSRVTNLCEYCPDLTAEKMKGELIHAFSTVYGMDADCIKEEELPEELLKEGEHFFGSAPWKYGRHLPFSTAFSRRFTWGEAELRLVVEKGIIRDSCIYSDGLDETFLLKAAEVLKGCPFDTAAISYRLDDLLANAPTEERNPLRHQITEDLKELIESQEI